jgi:hypothetical protein
MEVWMELPELCPKLAVQQDTKRTKTRASGRTYFSMDFCFRQEGESEMKRVIKLRKIAFEETKQQFVGVIFT